MTAELLGGATALCVVLAVDRGRTRSGSRPSAVPLGSLALGAGAIALGLTGSVMLFVLVPMVVLVGTVLVKGERRRRADMRLSAELPIVVDLLARRLSVGATVPGAIEALSVRQLSAAGLTGALGRIRSGQSVTRALEGEQTLLSAALLATEISGGTGSRAVERLADRLRLSALDGHAAQAQSGQQLASAAVMAVMPPVVSVLFALSDARAAHFYLHTPWGAAVVVTSLALSALSWVWMRRITRPQVPS